MLLITITISPIETAEILDYPLYEPHDVTEPRSWIDLNATMTTLENGSATVDWPGRYFHIDQILDQPGPRTDPGFAAGAEACLDFSNLLCQRGLAPVCIYS